MSSSSPPPSLDARPPVGISCEAFAQPMIITGLTQPDKSRCITKSHVVVNHLLQPRNLRLQPAFARLLQFQFAAEVCRLSVIGYYVLAHLSNSLNLSSSLLCWPTVTVSPL